MDNHIEPDFAFCRAFTLRLVLISAAISAMPLLFVNLMLATALIAAGKLISTTLLLALNIAIVWLSLSVAAKYLLSSGLGRYTVRLELKSRKPES